MCMMLDEECEPADMLVCLQVLMEIRQEVVAVDGLSDLCERCLCFYTSSGEISGGKKKGETEWKRNPGVLYQLYCIFCKLLTFFNCLN